MNIRSVEFCCVDFLDKMTVSWARKVLHFQFCCRSSHTQPTLNPNSHNHFTMVELVALLVHVNSIKFYQFSISVLFIDMGVGTFAMS
jgi:hypothetical protein